MQAAQNTVRSEWNGRVNKHNKQSTIKKAAVTYTESRFENVA
jgi:hypothetical protein